MSTQTPTAQPQAAYPHPITVYDSQLAHPGTTDDGPVYFRDSPLRLVANDLGVVIRHSPQIPNIIFPLSLRSDLRFRGLLVQIVYIFISIILTAVGIASFFTGLPTPIWAALAIVVVIITMSRIQGNVKDNHDMEDEFPEEAWLFVNGIATSGSGLQLILTHLHTLFGRKVTGIHNKTFGIWWDLVECLLQREFSWPTADVRVGYETICRHIRDPKKTKVVLIAHSQGGIIMSTWIDQLLSDFPADALRKVEIYTFASAANHFSVPSAPINHESQRRESETVPENEHVEARGTGSRQVGRRFVFGATEHFVNTRDYVSLIGLLEFAPPPPDNTVSGVLSEYAAEGRFAGRIFRREGHTGHLLLAHYLKPTDSILDHPTVKKYSQLVRYKHGQRASDAERYWKPTAFTTPVALVSTLATSSTSTEPKEA